MFIQTEATTDDNVMRFFPGAEVSPEGQLDFDTTEAAKQRSPLAADLLAMEDISAVSFTAEEIIVTKEAAVEWFHLKPSVLGAIMEHFITGKPVVLPAGDTTAQPVATEDADADPQIVHQVREVIDTRITPALAGEGNVTYHALQGSVLYIEMDGIAGTHISAISNMIRHYVPEVTTVRDVKQPAGEGLSTETGQKIQRIIDEKINPAVASHGGYITLIDVKEHQVFVELGGGCQGCGMANVTLKQGIEVAIKEDMPHITEVLDVTDHGGGDNPYYKPSKK
jgi:Fe-S cluster biogenesis protein NfuA